MAETKNKVQKKSKWKSLKSEFNKIVWPDKITLAKQTVAVVTLSVILGGIIAIVDAILKIGIDFWVR